MFGFFLWEKSLNEFLNKYKYFISWIIFKITSHLKETHFESVYNPIHNSKVKTSPLVLPAEKPTATNSLISPRSSGNFSTFSREEKNNYTKYLQLTDAPSRQHKKSTNQQINGRCLQPFIKYSRNRKLCKNHLHILMSVQAISTDTQLILICCRIAGIQPHHSGVIFINFIRKNLSLKSTEYFSQANGNFLIMFRTRLR